MLAFRPPWTWSGNQILAVCYGATAGIVLLSLIVDRIRYGKDGFKARWDRSWPRPFGSRALDLLAGLGLGMGVAVAWHLLTG